MSSEKEEKKEPVDSGPYSMTEEILKKRLHQTFYGHTWRQLFAGVLACLSSISFGTCLGWAHSVSCTISKDPSDFSDIAWLLSIILLGCSFGVTSSTLLLRQMGPKRVLQVVGPFYILNWFLILTPSVKTHISGRFFLGVLALTYSTAGETLLMQTVNYGIRRYITIFYNSTTVLGVLISRVAGTATTQFRSTLVCALIPVLHLLLIQIVPESPVFLYATSHVAAAKSLAWYRGEGNFYADMAYIKRDYDASRQDADAYRYMLFSKVVYRPLLIVAVVTILQITTGYFIFMFYSIEVLTEGKIIFSRVADSAIVSTFFIFTKIFWGTLHTTHNEWKVRGFLVASCFFTASCLGLFSIYLILAEHNIDIWINRHFFPMAIVMFFLFFVDMGLNHFPKILIFEYMPFQMYRRAHSIVQSFFWLSAFFNIYIFTAFFHSVHSYTIFFFLSGCTFFGTLFCYIFVVEPKGKSLIQVQLEFGGNPIGTRGALYNQTKQTL